MLKRLLSALAAVAAIVYGADHLVAQNAIKRLRVVTTSEVPPTPPTECDFISDGSRLDTQTKIDAAVASSEMQPTVCIPSGTHLWTTTVTIPNTKGIILACQNGAASTIIRRSGTSFPFNQFKLLELNVAPGNAVTRVTGCTWDQDHPHRVTSVDPFTTNILVVGYGVDRFRIDNNIITGLAIGGVMFVQTSTGFQNGAELSGLVDRNIIRCDPLNDGSCHSVSTVASPAWDTNMAMSVAAGWGACFARPFTHASGVGIGSNRSIYIEDNTFDNNGLDQDGLTDTFGCVQIVFRNNTSNGSQPGNHGFDSAAYRAPRWMEIYRNSMTLGSDNTACGVFRGGGLLYFDNLCDHPTEARMIALQTYRARGANTNGLDIFIPDHGPCNGAAHTINVDGNAGTGTNIPAAYPSISTGGNPGWPCLDQIGWMFDQDGAAGYTSFPALIFNNNDGAGGQVIASNYELDYGNLQNYMKCNRDFYVGNSGAYGTVTEGNCTTGGVKRGTLAARPSMCTTGVFYWATDQGSWNTESAALHATHTGSTHTEGEDGVLYRCTATDTWTVHYTPYTYPHTMVTP